MSSDEERMEAHSPQPVGCSPGALRAQVSSATDQPCVHINEMVKILRGETNPDESKLEKKNLLKHLLKQ